MRCRHKLLFVTWTKFCSILLVFAVAIGNRRAPKDCMRQPNCGWTYTADICVKWVKTDLVTSINPRELVWSSGKIKILWPPCLIKISVRRCHLFSFTSSWRTPLYNQFSSGNKCGCFLQLLTAAVEFGSQWSVSWTHIFVLPPGEGDISGEYAPWLGLLDQMGRLEKAPASAFGTCGHSVCCDLCAIAPGHFAALWTTGSSHPCMVLSLKVPW